MVMYVGNSCDVPPVVRPRSRVAKGDIIHQQTRANVAKCDSTITGPFRREAGAHSRVTCPRCLAKPPTLSSAARKHLAAKIRAFAETYVTIRTVAIPGAGEGHSEYSRGFADGLEQAAAMVEGEVA